LKLVFVDTGAFYALADKRDPAHSRAKRFYKECASRLLTTDFIFAETMSLMTKRLGKDISVAFGRGILGSPAIRIEEPTAPVRETAWSIFSRHLDKDYDLIDCISFSIMDAFGIREAFGFDQHFRQYGFHLLP
jgi:hypothetical protein